MEFLETLINSIWISVLFRLFSSIVNGNFHMTVSVVRCCILSCEFITHVWCCCCRCYYYYYFFFSFQFWCRKMLVFETVDGIQFIISCAFVCVYLSPHISKSKETAKAKTDTNEQIEHIHSVDNEMQQPQTKHICDLSDCYELHRETKTTENKKRNEMKWNKSHSNSHMQHAFVSIVHISLSSITDA